MAQATYSVNLPDGRSAKRRTARLYTHVVAVQRAGDGVWGVDGWCGSEALAVAAEARLRSTLARYGNAGLYSEIRVLPISGGR